MLSSPLVPVSAAQREEQSAGWRMRHAARVCARVPGAAGPRRTRARVPDPGVLQAYLNVAVAVARYDAYRLPLARHLVHVQLRHWEKPLRELSARALAALSPSMGASYLAGEALGALIPWCTDPVRSSPLRGRALWNLGLGAKALGVAACKQRRGNMLVGGRCGLTFCRCALALATPWLSRPCRCWRCGTARRSPWPSCCPRCSRRACHSALSTPSRCVSFCAGHVHRSAGPAPRGMPRAVPRVARVAAPRARMHTRPRSPRAPAGAAAIRGDGSCGPPRPVCWSPVVRRPPPQVAGLVPAIDKARLYRGKGGEVMREAVSKLVWSTSRVGLPLSAPQHAKVSGVRREGGPGDGAQPLRASQSHGSGSTPRWLGGRRSSRQLAH